MIQSINNKFVYIHQIIISNINQHYTFKSVRLNIVTLFELQILDSMISEVAFKGRFYRPEQSEIGVSSIIPISG